MQRYRLMWFGAPPPYHLLLLENDQRAAYAARFISATITGRKTQQTLDSAAKYLRAESLSEVGRGRTREGET